MWPPVFRRASDALAVLERSEASIVHVVKRRRYRPVETYQLLSDRRSVGSGDAGLQVHQKRAESTTDLWRGRTVLPDLREPQVEVVAPATGRERQSYCTVAVPVLTAFARLATSDTEQQGADVVDHLGRRRRIIDRGRQCPDRYVHHHPNGERWILVDGPLLAERQLRSQPLGVLGARGTVEVGHHGAGHHEVTDGVPQVAHQVATSG